ncbi:GNAT family N-acetyltransferase [Fictibacillus sp. BK138]|uniref:GNAT family N-acetyltransferase n=1 Tax=Fictibacillus sp. BK138 TaxID=2512121 RepID=UPI00102A7DF8|nr:GNAT family N-acetyltransferase [Fictibacillus sp. BK138]RZT21696.1 acetyltransferase (GNAT) family protein [Fictibacillus sp. BK138]
MEVKYLLFDSMPEKGILEGIIDLHKRIFGESDDLVKKMDGKPRLLVNVAWNNSQLIGYKIGYELDKKKFYSWLGGVDTRFRGHGVASKLMEQQHQYLKENGYHIVQTKTMNKWRSMLILNIKSGFDIIETYTNKKGLHKIILEKNLLS